MAEANACYTHVNFQEASTVYHQFYETISKPFRSERAKRSLVLIDKGLVALVAIVFIGIALWLVVHQDERAVRYMIVCAISFVALSALRAKIDRPRPYEAFDISPIILKKTQGKSFPSRHIFSATVIACALLWLNAWLGLAGFAAMAAIAIVRVVGGVHYPSDVVAAAVFGINCGMFGFFFW